MVFVISRVTYFLPPLLFRLAVTSTTAVYVRRTVLHPLSTTLSLSRPNPTQTRSSALEPPASRLVLVRTYFCENLVSSRKLPHSAQLVAMYLMIKCFAKGHLDDSRFWEVKEEKRLFIHFPCQDFYTRSRHSNLAMLQSLQATSITFHHT